MSDPSAWLQVVYMINKMSPYLLLGFLLAGLMHAFIPGRWFQRYLAGRNARSVAYAALFGIPLPLCSCGVIPTAMSLKKEGASKGATVSFLIATPQTGVDSIIATYSLMGLPFALVRPVAALVTALWGGLLTNVSDNAPAAASSSSVCNGQCAAPLSLGGKLQEALRYAFYEMMHDIGRWLVVGLAVAGLITVFVPAEVFAIFEGNTWASMLLVLCIAMPMYLCATGSIPIAVALMMKGLTPGAALVLLMAGPACNFASMLVVKKVLGMRTLIVYLLSIVLGAVSFGCLIDYMQFHGLVDFLQSLNAHAAHTAHGSTPFAWCCTALLAVLLVNALCIPHTSHVHTETQNMNRQIYHIDGMSCNHCRKSAEDALRKVAGVTSAQVDLASREAVVEGTATREALAKALDDIGFTLV